MITLPKTLFNSTSIGNTASNAQLAPLSGNHLRRSINSSYYFLTMINKYSKIIIVLLFVLSCKSEDETLYDSTGVATKLPLLWHTSITDDNKQLAETVLRSPVVYNDTKILMGANEKNGQFIYSVDSDNGKILWKWNDLLGILPSQSIKDPIGLTKEATYQFNNLLYFNFSTSSYLLNLQSGTTVSKYKVPLQRNGRLNTGVNNTVYSIGSSYDIYEDEKIYISSMNPIEKETPFLTPNYTTVNNMRFNGAGRIYSQITFKKDSEDFLAFTIINQISADLPNNTTGVYELNLYNLTKKEWVYQKKSIRNSGKSIGAFDLIYDNQNLYFMSSDIVYCHDAISGNERWATNIGSAPLTSRMMLVNKKLYAACEDRFLYSLDATSGQLLWKEQNTGTCSPISYLNGILYYLGGGDGKLHAVDASTGKHLWRLKSSDVDKNVGAFFYGVCVAVAGKNGEKGKVIATTGQNAYCFEAIK